MLPLRFAQDIGHVKAAYICHSESQVRYKGVSGEDPHGPCLSGFFYFFILYYFYYFIAFIYPDQGLDSIGPVFKPAAVQSSQLQYSPASCSTVQPAAVQSLGAKLLTPILYLA